MVTEIRDYINIDPKQGGGDDYIRKFSKLLDKKEVECRELELPFCRTCANIEFTNRIKNLQNEMFLKMQMNQYNEKEFTFDVDMNFEEFTGENYFTVKGYRRFSNKKIINGTVIQVPIFYKDYKCKRGHGYAIEIGEEEPDDFNKEIKAKKKKAVLKKDD